MHYNHKRSWIFTKWYFFAFVLAKYNCIFLHIKYEKRKTLSPKSLRFTVDHRGKDRFHTFFVDQTMKETINFGKTILDSLLGQEIVEGPQPKGPP